MATRARRNKSFLDHEPSNIEREETYYLFNFGRVFGEVSFLDSSLIAGTPPFFLFRALLARGGETFGPKGERMITMVGSRDEGIRKKRRLMRRLPSDNPPKPRHIGGAHKRPS